MDVSQTLFRWVEQNAHADTSALRLKYAGKSGDFDYSEAILQIECRRKFGRKLAATLASFSDFYFPSVLAGEQSSSDILGDYHASLIPEGASVIDLTSGLGIDVLHIARRALSVVAVERDEKLVNALRYNSQGLSMGDIVFPVCADCTDYIDRCIADGRRFDVAFIDPARRASDGGRLYALADCSPDVVALLPKISRICSVLVIKASPMLDISHTVSALDGRPTSIVAAGTTTECKELVVIVVFNDDTPGQTMIEAVTLGLETPCVFSYTSAQESSAPLIAVSPEIKVGDYIHEPYPAVMKSGAFKILASSFGLRGFHDNTRLLFSSDLVEGFPGTIWEVVEILPYASSVIKRFKSKYPAISIVTRNFGMNADALRSRLGVREASGGLKLFALTDSSDRKKLIIATRV